MIVVDTNIVAYLYILGAKTDTVRSVLQRDSTWFAPGLWRSEFRNVLVSCIRRGSISMSDALFAMNAAIELVQQPPTGVDSRGLIQMAYNSGCSAYDCEFVALALDLNVPLVTCDKQLIEKFPGIAVSPEAFVSREQS